MAARKKGRIGSSFDAFLKEEKRYEQSHAVAIKRVLAWQIEREMEKQAVSKAEMARRMKTSRSQLDRLLDPNNDAVSLETLVRGARAVGRHLKLELA
jgi:predicted XRE-type DNA-binding protein